MLSKLPIAPWGWKDLNLFGWPLVVATVVCVLLPKPWCLLGFAPLILLIWLISFFRDPPRIVPDGGNVIVAPADGTIADITLLDAYQFIGQPSIRIGIFLSIFNVHINRAPTAGKVLELHYHPGEFHDARSPESIERNEFMWIGMERPDRPQARFAVRQISGLLARRIVCTLKPGQTVTRGEKFGMIKLGSRTEVILPADLVDVTVKVGDKIRAGTDIVARWR
jgi:phosphatidylserine decarboxylase